MIDDLRPYPVMKDPGVPWLGNVPEHWAVSKVKHLARGGYKTFVDGDWIESPYITDSGIRLIQTGNIGLGTYREKGFRYISEGTFNDLGCTEFFRGDVLICRLGEPVGRACLAPDLGIRMITSVDVCILKPREDVLSAFVVFAMSSPRYLDWVNSLVRGSTRDRVSRSMLGGFVVPLPPLPEQVAIVHYLRHLERRTRRYIRAKQKLIKLLEEQKQAIIHRAVTRGLNPNVRLKPSGVEWLGDVPEHWKVMRCRYLFREIDNRSSDGSEEHLSMSQRLGLVPSDQVQNQTLVSENYAGGKLCEIGDLVLNRLKAHLGVFAIARYAGVISPDYTVLRPLELRCASYFESVLRSPASRFELRSRAKGIVEGFWRLYTDDFYNIRLPVPPLEERAAIIEHIAMATSEIESAITGAEREIALLREYHTCVIADVVTGKLDVREAVVKLPVEQDESELVDEPNDVSDAGEDEAPDADSVPDEAEA